MGVNEDLLRPVDQKTYESEQRCMVAPDEMFFPEEFYMYRRLASEREQEALGSYAVETLVSVEHVSRTERGGYTVTFTWMVAEMMAREPQKVVPVSNDGFVMSDRPTKFWQRLFNKEVPTGYFLEEEGEWEYDLLDTDVQLAEPRPLSMA